MLVKWSLSLYGHFDFFLQNHAMGQPGPPNYAGWHDTKSARGLLLGPKAKHKGRWGMARQARGPSRRDTLRPVLSLGLGRAGPARPDGHL